MSTYSKEQLKYADMLIAEARASSNVSANECRVMPTLTKIKLEGYFSPEQLIEMAGAMRVAKMVADGASGTNTTQPRQ